MAAVTPAPTGMPLLRLTAGLPVTITTIHMLDANTGWAIGGVANVGDHVLQTGDGGNTWRNVTPPEPALADSALMGSTAIGFFLDANTAWVTYGNNFAPSPAASTVWRTHDSGQTWEPSQPMDISGLGDYFAPSDMQLLDNQNGWLLVHLGVGMNHDYVAILHTADGGLNWERVVDPAQDNLQMSCEKTGMIFADARMGWVTGDCHGVAPGLFFYRTNDGGLTWTEQPLPPPADAPDLFQRDEIGCGTYSPSAGAPQAMRLAVSCVHFTADPIRTDNFLYVTADGGQTWRYSSSPANALKFISPAVGWALIVNNQSGPPQSDLYQTQDGGQTWTKIKTLNWSGRLDFINEQEGWAVARAGDAVALVHTSDGGKTWKEIKPQIAP